MLNLNVLKKICEQPRFDQKPLRESIEYLIKITNGVEVHAPVFKKNRIVNEELILFGEVSYACKKAVESGRVFDLFDKKNMPKIIRVQFDCLERSFDE